MANIANKEVKDNLGLAKYLAAHCHAQFQDLWDMYEALIDQKKAALRDHGALSVRAANFEEGSQEKKENQAKIDSLSNTIKDADKNIKELESSLRNYSRHFSELTNPSIALLKTECDKKDNTLIKKELPLSKSITYTIDPESYSKKSAEIIDIDDQTQKLDIMKKPIKKSAFFHSVVCRAWDFVEKNKKIVAAVAALTTILLAAPQALLALVAASAVALTVGAAAATALIYKRSKDEGKSFTETAKTVFKEWREKIQDMTPEIEEKFEKWLKKVDLTKSSRTAGHRMSAIVAKGKENVSGRASVLKGKTSDATTTEGEELKEIRHGK
ncbi:MAG: hypothetical protein A3C44_02650 [Gammaproteobacteria bacterium RIFCSPHIGHO2_02_FULL_39_13]|nr:MAG: hypothetical protein A3C44_02650 [Gammaproteobacteria bacterium RIFCSPHIGHO2_02_FULL_39_13]OGT50164.1 MAG: hypothetical protein A3E53_01955 [Gammaproteobacteria bacterium RIFCSPHIGHO2_12_FULL_39_24]